MLIKIAPQTYRHLRTNPLTAPTKKPILLVGGIHEIFGKHKTKGTVEG